MKASRPLKFLGLLPAALLLALLAGDPTTSSAPTPTGAPFQIVATGFEKPTGVVVDPEGFLLLTDREGRLAGLITMRDIDKMHAFPNACKDRRGRLRVGAATGVMDLARVEALIGATYVDGGFERALGLVRRLFGEVITASEAHAWSKDPKTELQEWLQARSRELPAYRVLRETGPAHRRHFEVRCELVDADLHTEAQGGSRRIAEQQAAEQMLTRLTGGIHG